MFRRAFYRTLMIAVLVVAPMSVVQLIKDTFKPETTIITVISILVVGVPFYYYIEKKYAKEKK